MEATNLLLENEWTIYFDRSVLRDNGVQKGGLVDHSTWTSQQNKVGVFNTVAGFWSYWNNLVVPSRLPMEGTYSCFLSHIQPAWEDKENMHGGEIRMFFSKSAGATVDVAWSNLLMAAVGETLSNDLFSVCGLTVSRKKHKSKISVWINRSDAASIAALEEGIRCAIGSDTVSKLGLTLDWTNHQQLLDKEQRKDSFNSSSSSATGSTTSTSTTTTTSTPNGLNNSFGAAGGSVRIHRSNNNIRVARPPSIGGESAAH